MVISKNTLTIFDADFLPFTATMGNKVFDTEGNPLKEDNKFVYTKRSLEEVLQAAEDIISNILNRTKADYFVGYLGGCKSFRYNVYPDYKANRKDKVLPDYYWELRDYLKDKWKFIETTDGLEADDAVNIVRNNLQKAYNCIIVSSDKDLVKSIKGTYLVPRDLSTIITTTEEEATKFFWSSMITGDVTDNIKGLKGKGVKYTETLFSRDNTLYYDDVLWAYIHQYGENEGIEQFYKNYKCLHILDKFSNFVTPELNLWKPSTKYYEVIDERVEEIDE